MLHFSVLLIERAHLIDCLLPLVLSSFDINIQLLINIIEKYNRYSFALSNKERTTLNSVEPETIRP
jgi:hypothetical protein